MTLNPSIHLQQICNLSQLKKGDYGTIMGIANADESRPESIRTRLLELGFLPGEKIFIVAESFWGRDPIAVRIGNATFALRRLEASMIYITKDTLENA